MALKWRENIRETDVNTILLLDDLHFSYLKLDGINKNLAHIINHYPYIGWFIKNKLPDYSDWVDSMIEYAKNEPEPSNMNTVIGDFFENIFDWVIYVTDPNDYHKLSFVGWDENEMLCLTDFSDKVVVDIGSGTGKQAFAAAKTAKTVYCVEPVWNLRQYLKKRAKAENHDNIYVVDGTVTELPYADAFADIVTSGHVVGDDIDAEIKEMERITKKGGMVIMCPGNNDADNSFHKQIISHGYSWDRFLEPGNDDGSGLKRKYWKIIE